MRKHKNVYGRTYTTFGFVLHTTLTVVGLLSFLLLLCFTGSCEFDQMALKDYAVRGLICLSVMGLCITIESKLF